MAPTKSMPRRPSQLALVSLALVTLTAAVPAAVSIREMFELSLSWPEEQRTFLLDGPGFLLRPAERDELLDLDTVGRGAWIETLLADPIPETPANELRVGIERRQALVRSELMTFLDVRSRLLFLHGAPSERLLVDCVAAFKASEIWTYPSAGLAAGRKLLVYQPGPDQPWRLWLPSDGKSVLYVDEMEYLMRQVEEFRRRGDGLRYERQICKQSEEVEAATGITLLFGFKNDRPRDDELVPFLTPPAERAAWARQAATTPLPEAPALPVEEIQVSFPERAGARMETHLTVVLPKGAEIGIVTNDREREEMRLSVEGMLEQEGRIFDRFRMRFLLTPPDQPTKLALVAPRKLRPGQSFLARVLVTDEVTKRSRSLSIGFTVPTEPTPIDEAQIPVPGEMIVALGDELKRQRMSGLDSIILIPPETDVVFGLWRAEALVTGSAIQRVAFFLDEQQVFKRSRPPFTAELRLPPYPVEQIVRVEGYDADGQLIASDEAVLNQPRGALQVRIMEPERGGRTSGKTDVRVEVVVPEERKVERVTFSVDEVLQAELDKPPWQAEVDVPASYAGSTELHYLTVTAYLDDGLTAEDVRFLNPPPGIEEVDVNLVELYTTVTDKNGRLVRGLDQNNFKVWEDSRPQTIAKFELVENLPLTLGVTIDTSGSMFESLIEAKRAAVDFLETIITPQDTAFALAFADRPELVMPRTSDVGAIAERLETLLASGSTALHDAVVTSLYYYRGIRGRRALVLLSDGEDTSSTITFPETLEYARRSGVAIYSIGLRIGKTQIGVRKKLEAMSSETGGRTFYIKEAEELRAVYDEIEEELRSQYLVAYNSDQAGERGTYREVAVEVRDAQDRKLEARTVRGYYQ